MLATRKIISSGRRSDLTDPPKVDKVSLQQIILDDPPPPQIKESLRQVKNDLLKQFNLLILTVILVNELIV